MAVDPAKVLAFVQIMKIGVSVVEAYQKGELTEDEMAGAEAQVRERVATAHEDWQASKETPAATARRNET